MIVLRASVIDLVEALALAGDAVGARLLAGERIAAHLVGARDRIAARILGVDAVLIDRPAPAPGVGFFLQAPSGEGGGSGNSDQDEAGRDFHVVLRWNGTV